MMYAYIAIGYLVIGCLAAVIDDLYLEGESIASAKSLGTILIWPFHALLLGLYGLMLSFKWAIPIVLDWIKNKGWRMK